MQMLIENMTCGGCVRSVTKAIRSLDADAKVSADLETRIVEIDARASRDQIVAALAGAGFEAR